jgi:hypothetical protein
MQERGVESIRYCMLEAYALDQQGRSKVLVDLAGVVMGVLEISEPGQTL